MGAGKVIHIDAELADRVMYYVHMYWNVGCNKCVTPRRAVILFLHSSAGE